MWWRIAIMSFLALAIANQDLNAYTLGDFMNDLVQPGRRRGLIARMDIGGGLSLINVEYMDEKLKNSDGALAMTGGFGYAPTDQFVLQMNLRWAVYASAFDDDNDVLWLFILGPFGPLLVDKQLILSFEAGYYFRPSVPSWYVDIGVGPGGVNNPFDNRDYFSTFHDGLGISAAVGYEFTKHVNAEISVLWTHAKEDYSSGRQEWDGISILASIGIMGY